MERLRAKSTGNNVTDLTSYSASHPLRANQAWIGGDGASTTTVIQSGGVAKISIGSNWTSNLDAYEEGTWTPTVVTGGYTIGSSTGRYTRIGRLVTCIADISLAGTGTTAELVLGGLPFTNLASGYSANATYFQFINTDNRNLSVRTHTSANTLFFQIVPSSTGTARVALGNDFSAGYCNVNVTYNI